MSISHSLNLATPMPAAEVARALNDIAQGVRLFDSTTMPEQLLTEGVDTRFGTWVRVFAANPKPWNPLITDLEVTPTVSVAFRLDKTDDLSGQEDDIVRLVSGLLTRLPGDAVLQYHYEVIWLLRRGGELSLNERDDLWTPARLAAVPQPYRRETHEFSEED
ncbi:SitI3 family protein [Streptomyces sp. NRRL S-495]|uniref:SitI3 family protein n=1 Tax=Streptomyces sp. NRRL S-495 TaxID=1609133 RepID=UPI0006970E29|nr:SitI3 family protein [Streptomyces sp. NRRL S-495]